MNSIQQNPSGKEKEAKATQSKIGVVWSILLGMFGLMVLGAIGAFLTGNIPLAQALMPWLVAPFLLGFGIYVLCELLIALEAIAALFTFVGWCAKKVWGFCRFLFGFKSQIESEPKNSSKQNEKSMH